MHTRTPARNQKKHCLGRALRPPSPYPLGGQWWRRRNPPPRDDRLHPLRDRWCPRWPGTPSKNVKPYWFKKKKIMFFTWKYVFSWIVVDFVLGFFLGFSLSSRIVHGFLGCSPDNVKKVPKTQKNWWKSDQQSAKNVGKNGICSKHRQKFLEKWRGISF